MELFPAFIAIPALLPSPHFLFKLFRALGNQLSTDSDEISCFVSPAWLNLALDFSAQVV
jgi:hypothetical protein